MTPVAAPAGVTLRPAVLPADRPALEAMMAALQDFERAVAPDRLPGTEMAATHMAALLGEVASKDGRVILAEVGAGQPVGFALGWIAETLGRYIVADKARYGLISDLFVAEAWRGRGIGRALIRTMEAHFHSHGLTRTAIHALADNDAARRRYLAAGYRMASVEMVRDLSG